MAVKYTDFPLKFLVLFILNHWRFNLPIMNKDPLYTPNNYSCKRAKPTSHQHFACVATRGVVESAHKTTEGVKSCWEQLHCPATSSGWWTTKKFLSSEFGKFEKCKTLSVIFHYLSKQRRVCVCVSMCVSGRLLLPTLKTATLVAFQHFSWFYLYGRCRLRTGQLSWWRCFQTGSPVWSLPRTGKKDKPSSRPGWILNLQCEACVSHLCAALPAKEHVWRDRLCVCKLLSGLAGLWDGSVHFGFSPTRKSASNQIKEVYFLIVLADRSAHRRHGL